MSGFEVAGIVLGAIPLFISAAEHYRDGLDSIDRFFKKERILQQYVSELQVHQTILTLHLKHVIGSTQLPPDLQRELVEDPMADVWQSPTVQAQLQQQLGTTSDVFLALMQRMAETFLQQVFADDTLPLPSTTQSPRLQIQSLRETLLRSQRADASQLKQFYTRIKFTWRSPKRNETILTLKECNQNLNIIIKGVESSTPYRKNQEVARAHDAWRTCRHAQRLWNVLNLACNCACRPFHMASLKSEPLCQESHGPVLNRSRFDIYFYQLQGPACCSTITVFDTDALTQKRSKVQIAVDQNTSISLPDRSAWKLAADLCESVREAATSQAHVMFAIEDDNFLYKDPTSHARNHTIQIPASTLSSLYPQFTKIIAKRWFIREKLILALSLTYTVLQLCESQWLAEGVNSDNVFFTENCFDVLTNPVAQAGAALGRPYISNILDRRQVCCQDAATGTQSECIAILTSLGITLLEIHLNETIPRQQTDRSQLRWQAIALFEEHHDDFTMSPQLSEVIQFCLFPKAGPRSRTIQFSDSSFRETYYRNTVLPLESELKESFGLGSEIWKSL